MKPKDSQRSRVYAWEKKFYSMKRNKDFTTLTSIQRFLDDVRDDIGLDAKIEVVSSRKLNSNWAWAKTYEGQIVLPGGWARTMGPALHELSHHIVYHHMEKPNAVSIAWHGPEFVSVFTALMHTYMGNSLDVMLKHMDKHKVKHDEYILEQYLWPEDYL